MYCVSQKFYQAVTIKKRILTSFITTLTLFAILYSRTLLVLHHDRKEHSQTKFLYLACKDQLKALKSESSSRVKEKAFRNLPSTSYWQYLKSPSLRSILEAINGTKTITGLFDIKALQSSKFILPHLEKRKNCLRPAFHLSGGRNMVDIVIGVTTVKRHYAAYLMETLKGLVEGLSEYDKHSTLIVVMIGEDDLEYVLRTAISIEKSFTREVNSGLIEVISPLKSYYPNKDTIPVTRQDSVKRTLWRTKHVLDCIYVMAYGHTKGSYYLIMEDDVVTKKGYMTMIKQLIEHTTTIKPRWTIIDFCNRFNGLGKLLKSSDVDHFMIYLQLFYYSMPLDYLIESYLRNLACDIYQKSCNTAVGEIKGKILVPLFKHVGLHSSLKGKIQTVEDFRGSTVPTFYPHDNPPLKYIHCFIESIENRTIQMAYEGVTYFLGLSVPTEGNFIEFWFRQPIVLKRYKFRSGNYVHKTFLLNKGIVEVLQSYSKTFKPVGSFDEFGYVEGNVGYLGELAAIRLRMTNVKKKYIVLSEIELVPENSSQPNV